MAPLTRSRAPGSSTSSSSATRGPDVIAAPAQAHLGVVYLGHGQRMVRGAEIGEEVGEVVCGDAAQGPQHGVAQTGGAEFRQTVDAVRHAETA